MNAPSIDKPYTWPNQLLICIPLAELGYSDFHAKLSDVEGFGWHMWKHRVWYHEGGYIHGAHNNLAKMMLELKDKRGYPVHWDRLVFLEHDHLFPADMLYRHAHYTQPIVSAIYVLRDINQPIPVVYNWDTERHNALPPNAAQVKHMLDNPGLHEVDVVPMGCVSIRRDVLEQWPSDQPMFNSFTNPRGHTMSDDVWFCRIAQDAGWQPYVDSSLQIDHICRIPIGIPYFVHWWNEKGAQERIKDMEKTA